MQKLCKRLRRENGQALVELAFVIPIVLLFLFGIIDFGLALNEQNQDTNVANIAAREASLGTVTAAQCNNQTYTTLKTWAICEAQVTGTPVTNVCVGDIATTTIPSSSTYSTGDPLEVEVQSSFGWLKLITGKVGNLTRASAGTRRCVSRRRRALRPQPSCLRSVPRSGAPGPVSRRNLFSRKSSYWSVAPIAQNEPQRSA